MRFVAPFDRYKDDPPPTTPPDYLWYDAIKVACSDRTKLIISDRLSHRRSFSHSCCVASVIIACYLQQCWQLQRGGKVHAPFEVDAALLVWGALHGRAC
jgi:hypothetical protein